MYLFPFNAITINIPYHVCEWYKLDSTSDHPPCFLHSEWLKQHTHITNLWWWIRLWGEMIHCASHLMGVLNVAWIHKNYRQLFNLEKFKIICPHFLIGLCSYAVTIFMAADYSLAKLSFSMTTHASNMLVPKIALVT